jgi:hypothetical protein
MSLAPRVYAVTFAPTAATAAVDFFELVAPAGTGICLLGLEIGQTTEAGDAAEEILPYSILRVTGAPTSGSGGSAPTPVPLNAGDSAAIFTAEAMNTTALSGGTSATVHQGAFNVRAGLQMWWPPEVVPATAVSSRLVVRLGAAPADSITWVGTAYVGELVP